MEIATIDGANVYWAKEQPEYKTLPARVENLEGGAKVSTSAWRPTPEELERLNQGACIELSVICQAQPPVMIEVGQPAERPLMSGDQALHKRFADIAYLGRFDGMNRMHSRGSYAKLMVFPMPKCRQVPNEW